MMWKEALASNIQTLYVLSFAVLKPATGVIVGTE